MTVRYVEDIDPLVELRESVASEVTCKGVQTHHEIVQAKVMTCKVALWPNRSTYGTRRLSVWRIWGLDFPALHASRNSCRVKGLRPRISASPNSSTGMTYSAASS